MLAQIKQLQPNKPLTNRKKFIGSLQVAQDLFRLSKQKPDPTQAFKLIGKAQQLIRKAFFLYEGIFLKLVEITEGRLIVSEGRQRVIFSEDFANENFATTIKP